jgi:hypothetical protein
VYGRMQYLLPWGLFGMHELIVYEAKRGSIVVNDGVSSLSALAAEGVPSFDALQLVVQLGIERVDATRLAKSIQGLSLTKCRQISCLRSLRHFVESANRPQTPAM